MEKYHRDNEFQDPVVRCTECSKLVTLEHLHEHGSCVCSNRRVRNVSMITEEEMSVLKENGIDPKFLALFEEADA